MKFLLKIGYKETMEQGIVLIDSMAFFIYLCLILVDRFLSFKLFLNQFSQLNNLFLMHVVIIIITIFIINIKIHTNSL